MPNPAKAAGLMARLRLIEMPPSDAVIVEVATASTPTVVTGNMYGTANDGGPYGSGDGMVWEITKDGAYIDLHDFGGTITTANGSSGPDGRIANAGVTVDSQGNLYGTTLYGGASGTYGMVWEITNDGVYKDLHDFGGTVTNANGTNGPDGKVPYANVSIGPDGALYGTTVTGGPYGPVYNGRGVVWKLRQDGTYNDLHDFGGSLSSGPDGASPYGGVTFDSKGNMFGTTYYGGANGQYVGGLGIVWELTKNGAYYDIHDFGGTIVNAEGNVGNDGKLPGWGVSIDGSGNLFGTTCYGGPYGGTDGSGMIWEITSNSNYIDLHDFGGTTTNANGTTGPDGASPFGGITLDGAGNLYGQTTYGGPYRYGTGIIFVLTKAHNYIDLHDFGSTTVNADGTVGPDGENPNSGVTFDNAGNLYGTATYGAPIEYNYGGFGMVWKIPGPQLVSVSVSPTSVTGGSTSTGTVTLSKAAGPAGAVVSLTSDSSNATVPVSVTVPYGSTTATFTVNTTAVDSPVVANISGTLFSTTRSAALTINPPVARGLTLRPSTVVGGSPSSGLLDLSGPAGPSGVVVNLASNSGAATLPATIMIPAGSSSGGFNIDTSVVTTSTSAQITANYGVVVQTTLTITPGGLTGLSLSLSTVYGGTPSVGTVTISGQAPAAG